MTCALSIPPFLGRQYSHPSLRQQTSEFLLRAKEDLDAIVRLMKSGEAPSTSTIAPTDAPDHPRRGPPDRILTHLQDLAPEDLPETQREVITGEIALFRERAAKRAAEKKAHEREMELKRNAVNNSGTPQRRESGQGANPGWGGRGGTVDPQSYNQHIGFVPGGRGPEGEGGREAPSVVSDEDRERERVERERREAEALYRDVSLRPLRIGARSGADLVSPFSAGAAARRTRTWEDPELPARASKGARCHRPRRPFPRRHARATLNMGRRPGSRARSRSLLR